MMSRVESTRTDVKRAFTSKEDMHSPVVAGWTLSVPKKMLDAAYMVGGTSYQWSKNACQFFSYTICNGTPDRHYNPKEGPCLWVLGNPYNLVGMLQVG